MMNVDFEVYVQPIIVFTVDLSESPLGQISQNSNKKTQMEKKLLLCFYNWYKISLMTNSY